MFWHLNFTEIHSIEPTVDDDGTPPRLQLLTPPDDETASITSNGQPLLMSGEQLLEP